MTGNLCGDVAASSSAASASDNNVAPAAAASSSADEGEYPTGFRLVATILALIFSIFLASLDMTIVATAIPKITDEFGGIDKVSWYGAAFFMTNGSYQTAWGKGYRFFSLKYTFLASVLVLEVGSLICALAPNPIVLILGRAITGLGAAGIGTGAYTIIAFIAPLTFLHMDVVGTSLIMGAIICFMLALEKGGQTEPWSSSVVIGTLVGFFVISIAFVVWEARMGERAVIVPRLVMTRSVGIGSLFAAFFAGSYLVVLYYMPIYFQSVAGVAPITSGIRNIPSSSPLPLP
ncbi:unnamed protein product [Parascedosporium putredinis]|uniref:Major facilitator superfamily (MFS) profile domain-containing protein n=1 Tax=Parascedosporium putredinis TaxID=1442378 RepID=A0A9P1MDR6_9PEZI|nr:unnamed protein product [Parascedosporium putredinis]CAI8000138.1 unnamed protein product [Parascedosporium putredinis]